jgi:hypothetical protein
VHNRLRNSLGKESVEKLVFIKTNAPSPESKTVSDWIEDEDEDCFDDSVVNSSVVDMIELEWRPSNGSISPLFNGLLPQKPKPNFSWPKSGFLPALPIVFSG